MSRRMRFAVLAVLIFAIAVGVWAVRPLHDRVKVGTDYNPTLLDPPRSAQVVYVDVKCGNVFASPARPDTPLPSLAPQPEGQAPLGYSREPCAFVQRDARRAFAIDVLVILAAISCLTYVILRRARRSEEPSPPPVQGVAS